MVLDFISKLLLFNKVKLFNKNVLRYAYLYHNPINLTYLNPTIIKFIAKVTKHKQARLGNYPTTQPSSNFYNKNFFHLESYFKLKHWTLVGTSFPQLRYDLSYTNEWKSELISKDTIKLFTKRFKKRFFNKKYFLIKKIKKNIQHINDLNGRSTIKVNSTHFKAYRIRAFQKNNLKKKIIWKKKYKKIIKIRSKKKKYLLNLRTSRFKITPNIGNNASYKLKTQAINLLNMVHIKPKFKKFQTRKRKKFLTLFKKHTKLLISLKTQNRYNSIVLNHFYKKFTKLLDFKKLFSANKSNFSLKKKIFKKVKHNFKFTFRIKRFNRRLKKTLYKLNYSKFSPIKHTLKLGTFKKKKKVTLTIRDNLKPQSVIKWRNNKPYLFTNEKEINFKSTPPLIETYLNMRLKPFTVHKVRNKRVQQTFSRLKKKKKLKIKNFIKKRLDFSKKKTKYFKKKLNTRNIILKFKDIYRKYKYNNLLSIKRKLSIKQPKLLCLNSHKNLKNSKPKNLNLRIFKKNLKLTYPIKNFFKNTNTKPTTFISIISNLKPSPKQINMLNVVAKKHKKPLLKTKTKNSFILKSPIIFFSKFLMSNKNILQKPKFNFKKTIFSFLKPNEIRQSLMDRKKHFYSYKIIFKQKSFFNKNFSFKPAKLKQLYNNILKRNHQNHLSKNILNGTGLNYKLFATQRTTIVSNTDIFNMKGVNQLYQRSEVRIPRIRFKPGYQRIWRQSRLALKEALRVKFTYQKKLSRHIVKFFKKINYYAFSASEMSIDRTVIYSRLVPDKSTFLIFLKQRLIYLNGKYLTNPNALTYENDLIQLIVSKWYYSAYRWISNWTLKRVKKYKRLIYRKGLSGRYKLMKQRKQKSFYVPNWIYLTRYDISDIKPYLEVDYLTLSAIIIYNPYVLTYNSPDEVVDYRPTIYRLYNWKYIT